MCSCARDPQIHSPSSKPALYLSAHPSARHPHTTHASQRSVHTARSNRIAENLSLSNRLIACRGGQRLTLAQAVRVSLPSSSHPGGLFISASLRGFQPSTSPMTASMSHRTSVENSSDSSDSRVSTVLGRPFYSMTILSIGMAESMEKSGLLGLTPASTRLTPSIPTIAPLSVQSLS